MKKSLFGIALFTAVSFSTTAFAGKDDHIIVQEAAKNVVSIKDVAKFKDETGVTLTGQITKHLAGDHYELIDRTGKISVEIDDDIWRVQALKVGDQVRVVGEVDTHRQKPADIEAVRVEKLHK